MKKKICVNFDDVLRKMKALRAGKDPIIPKPVCFICKQKPFVLHVAPWIATCEDCFLTIFNYKP